MIIELDDPSQLNKLSNIFYIFFEAFLFLFGRISAKIMNTKEDAERDAMLNEAGYIVLRFTEIPSIRQLHKHIGDHACNACLELFLDRAARFLQC